MATVELETYAYDDDFAEWLAEHNITATELPNYHCLYKYEGTEEALRKMISEHWIGDPEDHENSVFAEEYYRTIVI